MILILRFFVGWASSSGPSPEYKGVKIIRHELHSIESTYGVYPGFKLYASIVSCDNGSSRRLTIYTQ